MELGKLSAVYESNGDPAIVSTGEGDFWGNFRMVLIS